MRAEVKGKHNVSTAIAALVAICLSGKVCQQSVLSRTWEILLQRPHACSHISRIRQRQGFRTLPKTSDTDGGKKGHFRDLSRFTPFNPEIALSFKDVFAYISV